MSGSERAVFDEIREASAWVMGRARFISVDSARLGDLAIELSEVAKAPVQPDPAHNPVGPPGSTLAFVVTLDAVNFGSGYFPYLEKRPGCSG